MTINKDRTIIALSTPAGTGAIAVIRLSGPGSIDAVNAVFKGKNLREQASHTVHFGTITDGDEIIDEVLVTLFKAPHSYTKEDVIEISCHGSDFIVQRIIRLFLQHGVIPAKPGEFTQRAFLNGRFDLAKAEAVADLIASDSEAAHRTAMQQMRGGISDTIKLLREKLVYFASMIELELDFSEEDVEFADRSALLSLVDEIQTVTTRLTESFRLGNALKNGIPTVIAGKPNAGKSTLLNALLDEQKAIVSDIPGTTRDFIEDELTIEGIKFRFIDTAGIREAQDEIEALGIARTHEKMQSAGLIIYVIDLTEYDAAAVRQELESVLSLQIPCIIAANKTDLAGDTSVAGLNNDNVVMMSAAQGTNLDVLKEKLLEAVNLKDFKTTDTVVTNLRHFESLTKTHAALEKVTEGIKNGITEDLLASDIRTALHHLGEITGEISTDDLLATIFSKFCIGK